MTRSQPRPETALTGTGFALLAQLSTAVFTAVITLFLVRALGPDGFGELTLVLSVGGLTLVIADAAVAQSTGRYAADKRDDPSALAATVSSGLRVKLAFSTIAALGLVLFSGPIADAYGAPAMTWALRAMALSVLAESLVMLWLVAFQAMRQISLNVRLYLVESIAEAAAIVSLVTLGAGVTGAVIGRSIGYAVGAAAGTLLMARALGRWPDLRGDPATRREIRAYARPLFVNLATYSGYTQVSVQLVGVVLDRAAVGIYAAPLRILSLLSYPGQAVANAVAPRMAGRAPDTSAFTIAMRWLLLYQSALLAPIVLWAEPITVLLLGQEFRDSAVVLRAMAPYLWLAGISVLVSTTVNYLGHARRRVPVVVFSLLLNALLCLLLLPWVGVVGAAFAMSAAHAFYVPRHLQLCRESFPLPLGPLARTLVRSMLAACAFGAVLAAVGNSDISGFQWLLGVTLGPMAYVAALVMLRELTGQDLLALRAVLRGRSGPSCSSSA